MAELRIELRADIAALGAEVAALRGDVASYHGSIVGHGVLISELDERVSRLERGGSPEAA